MSNLQSTIENHLRQIRNEQKPSLKETSELYEYLHNSTFETDDMIKSLKLILCARTHFDLDVLFFSKGLFYSSIKNQGREDQLRFIHAFDKLNQLNQFVPKYLHCL